MFLNRIKGYIMFLGTPGERVFRIIPGRILFMLFLCGLTVSAFGENEMSRDSTISTVKLDSVLVKGHYGYFKRKGNMYTISFKNSPFYKDKSVTEALGRCPLITHTDESFNILGKVSTLIYINGKPSTLGSKDLYDYLSSLKSNDVDHIEIIPNSSAKYDADNKSGIINIIMSKKRDDGFLTVLNTSVSKGKEWGETASGLFAYRKGILNLNLFVNGSNAKKSRYSDTFYTYPDNNTVSENSNFHQTGKPLSTSLSLDLNTENNDLEFVYSFQWLKVYSKALQSENDTSLMDKISKQYNNNHIFQLSDDLHFSSTSASILYNLYYRKNKENNDFVDGAISTPQKDNDKYILNNVKVDFNTHIDSTLTFSYGLSGHLLRVNTVYGYDKIDNRSKYKEKTGGVYLSIRKQLGQLDISAGLRYELTSQLYDGSKKIYRGWYPYLNLSKDMGDKTLYLDYSKSIDRVPFDNLTLSPVYFMPDSYIEGNPLLKPTKTHNFDVGLNGGNFDVKLFDTYIDNGIFSYSYIDNDKKNVSTYKNYSFENQVGVNMSYNQQISSLMLLNVSLSSYYDYSRLNKNQHFKSWNNYFDGSLAIKWDRKGKFDSDISYWALFPQKENGSNWKNRASFAIGVNYNVIKNKLVMKLKLNDLFNQDNARYTNTYDNISAYHNNSFDKRYVSFTVQYMFAKNKQAKKNRNIDIDDVNRIPTE